jgi:DNA-binding NarL/FixJ family response regulator
VKGGFRLIKVLIADDQVILRESLKFIIEQDKEITVIGFAGNGKEALNQARHLMPDLVLMDIMMPICDGVEGTRLIKEMDKNIKVVILTTFNDDESVSKALENGADGYVLKDIKLEELVMAIKSTIKGLRVMHEDIFSNVVNELKTANSKKSSESRIKSLIELDVREIQIIKLIAKGKVNKEIAGIFNLSEGSLKNLITVILRKLNLQDRIQLVIYAVKTGIV